jgi:ERCC4-type nuclease
MQDKKPHNEESSRAFMDALTASDEQHRKAMRGMTPEIAAKLLKNCYGLTDEQAIHVQQLRDVEGINEDDAIKLVLGK